MASELTFRSSMPGSSSGAKFALNGNNTQPNEQKKRKGFFVHRKSIVPFVQRQPKFNENCVCVRCQCVHSMGIKQCCTFKSMMCACAADIEREREANGREGDLCVYNEFNLGV